MKTAIILRRETPIITCIFYQSASGAPLLFGSNSVIITNSARRERKEEIVIKKKIIGIISMVLVLVGPLVGGLIGKAVAEWDIMGMQTGEGDDSIRFLVIAAWIVASCIFYHSFSAKDE